MSLSARSLSVVSRPSEAGGGVDAGAPAASVKTSSAATWRLSLRWLLLFFIALIVAPMWLLEWLSIERQQDALLRRAQTNMQVLTDVTAASQEQFVTGIAQLLTAVGASSVVAEESRSACVAYFRRLQERQPALSNLGLINTHGHIVCGATSGGGEIRLEARPYYRQARDENVLAVSDYMVGALSGKPVLSFGLPVRTGSGVFKGVVFASVDLASLGAQLNGLNLPAAARVYLTDAQGVVLATSDRRRDLVGQPLPDAVLLAALHERRSGALAPGQEDGLLRLLRPVRVDGRARLFVAMTVPVAAVIEPAARHGFEHMLALLGVSLLSGALILLLGERWLVRPLRRVLRSIRLVRREDYALALAPTDSVWRELGALKRGLSGLVQVLEVQRSQRQRATQALRESEAHYRALFEAAPLPLWVLELSTQRFLAVNPAAAAHYGYTLQDFERMTLADIQPPQLQQADLEVPAVRPHRKRNGEICQMQVSSQPMTFDRRPARLCLATDVTQSLAAQERVREVNEHLERLVAERTREVALSNRELEAFASSVSHDLRNPLHAIAMFADLLAEHAGAMLDEQGHRCLSRIQDGTRQMEALIEDLLELARVTQAELVMAPVHLSALAQEVMQELRTQQPCRGVRVEIEPGLHGVGDERLLRQLLVNLLGNAWKFTARTAEPHIRVRLLSRPDEAACLCIVDNGAGFDMQGADKLFEPFNRLHDEADYPGSGVGLATVKRIVARHSGRIWATGVPGQGATFYVVLPGLHQQADHAAETRKAAAAALEE